MALSASAPPLVAKTIHESLHLRSPLCISLCLDLPNIFFSFSKSKGLAVSVVGVPFKVIVVIIIAGSSRAS